ncbi:MAG: ATP-binding protein [Candidatus Methanomethylophilus sp.]|nr:ATP-binding protein [Methanomethylophilus sp.]
MDSGSQLKENTLYQTDKKTKLTYAILFMVNLTIFFLGAAYGEMTDVIISIPIMIIILATLVYDSEFVHVPPYLIIVVNAAMILALIVRILSDDTPVLDFIVFVSIGVVLGSIGVIVAYMSLGQMPGFAREKPLPIVVESICVGIALYVFWITISYYLNVLINVNFVVNPTEVIVRRMVGVMFGSVIICSSFFIPNSPMRRGIEGFLDKNSHRIGIDTDGKERVLALIQEGESFSLEFKSTIRTNLNTGEKDKRMEKAVLKTLVAFLNSDGGTLLVGVSDDGEILGVDLESFDNLDKMKLHITNIISAQIGDEFIPFIRFKEVNFGKKEDGTDKLVIRFECMATSTPAFYKDGKTETYFVRSGPSSVDLSGSDLIKYVDNRRVSVKRKYLPARRLSQSQSRPEDDGEEA